MTNEIAQQVESLKLKAVDASEKYGVDMVSLLEKENSLLLHWLKFIIGSQQTGIANELLGGACASIRETAACLSLGLVRPALFAMRAQIDLVLAWLYFKDHPVEWQNVNDHGDGFKMKKEVLEYLDKNFKGYALRFNALKEVAARATEDPYRLLSAHVHAQSNVVLPIAEDLSDVVETEALAKQCTEVAREAAEYMNDILMAMYATKWAAIPDEVKANAEHRLASKKPSRDKFFANI